MAPTCSALPAFADYLQLQIGADHHFNLYVWPVVYYLSESLTKSQLGYRDRMCSFLGKVVKNLDTFLDAGLVIEFEDGAIEVPLDGDQDNFEIVEIMDLNISGMFGAGGKIYFSGSGIRRRISMPGRFTNVAKRIRVTGFRQK